jgi:hypothetical protein
LSGFEPGWLRWGREQQRGKSIAAARTVANPAAFVRTYAHTYTYAFTLARAVAVARHGCANAAD